MYIYTDIANLISLAIMDNIHILDLLKSWDHYRYTSFPPSFILYIEKNII